jgi:pyruvate,water dikinase
VISRIAAVIKKDERLSACIMAGEIANLDDVPKGAAHAALGDFFDKFGDRAVREAELSTPRWRENQKAVFGMLAAALGDCAQDPELIRERADGRAERCLAQLASGKRISPQISLVRVLVSHSRRMTALRESMRSWVTKALGSIRKVALEIDCRLLIQDPALAQGSVFFCTFEDCVRVMQSTDPQLSQLLSMRKADYLRDSSRPEPPVSFVGRPTYLHVPPAGGETMRGLAASGGVVEGRVRVISSPPREGETIEAGEILVARTTDVGLTPLFLVAAGVVTELGGPLSHAAIVAREYGVPAVVNVSGVTLAFRTGDRVRVDGNRGIVERLGARVGRDDGF